MGKTTADKKSTNKITTMQISTELWQFIEDNKRFGESKEQVLRRLLKFKEEKK